MLTLHDMGRSPGSVSRREWLRVGGLSAMGLSLSTLLQAHRATAAPMTKPSPSSNDLGATFGKARNVTFLWLQGGPSHHETLAPKPDAPIEIRGPSGASSLSTPK